jgi:hypothetical protein
MNENYNVYFCGIPKTSDLLVNAYQVPHSLFTLITSPWVLLLLFFMSAYTLRIKVVASCVICSVLKILDYAWNWFFIREENYENFIEYKGEQDSLFVFSGNKYRGLKKERTGSLFELVFKVIVLFTIYREVVYRSIFSEASFIFVLIFGFWFFSLKEKLNFFRKENKIGYRAIALYVILLIPLSVLYFTVEIVRNVVSVVRMFRGESIENFYKKLILFYKIK